MAWLVHNGKVLATVEVAESFRDRTRGLLGRDGIDGVMLLKPAKSVHTFGMRFPIDVAFCDRELNVVKVVTLSRNRVARPVLKAHVVLETEAGVMRHWGLRPGERLEVRGDRDAGGTRAADRGSAA